MSSRTVTVDDHFASYGRESDAPIGRMALGGQTACITACRPGRYDPVRP